MSRPKLLCPHCGQPLNVSLFTGFLGKKGGKTKGPTKARSSEQARAAVQARWAKYREQKKKGKQ